MYVQVSCDRIRLIRHLFRTMEITIQSVPYDDYVYVRIQFCRRLDQGLDREHTRDIFLVFTVAQALLRLSMISQTYYFISIHQRCNVCWVFCYISETRTSTAKSKATRKTARGATRLNGRTGPCIRRSHLSLTRHLTRHRNKNPNLERNNKSKGKQSDTSLLRPYPYSSTHNDDTVDILNDLHVSHMV